MPDESAAAPIEAYVLLSTVPADMGEVLSSIQPGMGDPMTGVPLLPAFGLDINGADLQIGAAGQPVTDPRLQADLGVSALRATLAPVLAEHRASIRLTVAPPPGAFLDPMITWANVLAYLLGRGDAGAIWLPDQRQLVTDVVFLGWMERDPVVNLTGVHAMWLDDARTASVAFTSGVAALGGHDLQLRAAAEPGALFEVLRAAAADELRQGRLPREGGTVTIGGSPHHLVVSTGVVDGLPVLDLVPANVSAQPAETPKKRRWPFG